MSLLADSLHVFLQNWLAIVELGFIAGCLALVVIALLSRMEVGEFSAAELFSLGAAGWVSLSVFTAALIFLFDRLHLAWLILLAFLAAVIFALAFLGQRRKRFNGARFTLPALFGLLLLLIFLRLAFLSKTTLPLYFDSAEHYRIIQVLIGELESPPPAPTLGWPAPTYYHLGFHLVTAILAAALRVDPKTMILLLGQIVLACIPISFYFIAGRASRTNLGGWFAVIFAGFGWYMPAHTMNWGKYPALTSLPTMLFSLSLAYWLATNKTQRARSLWILCALSIAVSLIVHSRSIIVIGIFIASWLAAVRWDELPRFPRALVLVFVCAALTAGAVWVNSTDLKTAFDPYFVKGNLVTLVVLLLAFFALREAPRVLFCGLLSIGLMLACLFVPVRGLPGFGDLSLLDRPFVEMTLFVPLAVIGGVGCAGLLRFLKKFSAQQKIIAPACILLLLLALLTNAAAKYSFHPSSCCQIVGPDDIAALDWSDKNLPSNARIAIASAAMNVQFNDPTEAHTGIDAGVWLAPLTKRTTLLLPFTSDFSSEAMHAQLCKAQINYLYVGGEAQSFDRQKIEARPAWYRTIFYLPAAQIEAVSGCP